MVLIVLQDGVAKIESQEYQTTPFLNESIRPTSYGIVLNCSSCTVARHWLVVWGTMLDTFRMLVVALMTGTLLHDVNISLESSTVIAQRVAESIHLRSRSAYHHRLNHRSQASQ
jgi:hypothetical protein